MYEENKPNKGQILVLLDKYGKLQHVTKKQTKSFVCNFNAFNGKSLADINQNIRLYKWLMYDGDSRDMLSKCGHHGHILALYVQSCGDFIVIGDLINLITNIHA